MDKTIELELDVTTKLDDETRAFLGEPPAGFEYVLMPARPYFEGGVKAPGEAGHYSDLNPEPIQVIEAWGLNFNAGAALKYLARFRKKNGIEDLKKVKFFVDRLIAELERERHDG